LLERIGSPVIRAEKDGPLFSPATFDPPKRGKKNAYITFRILKRSWTNRMFTVYLWREIAPRLTPFGRVHDPIEVDMYAEDLGHRRPGRQVYGADGELLRKER